MAQLPFDPDALEVPGAISLVVGWKRGRNLVGGEVPVAGDVKAHLREACDDTVEIVASKDVRKYDPDMQLEAEECLVASPNQVEGAPVLDLVFSEEPLPKLSGQDLPSRPLLFYAVVAEVDEVLVAFVRKTNPRPGAKPGRIGALLGDTLARVTDPVFFLDDSFDLILYEDSVVALRQTTFEALFRDASAIQAVIPDWVDRIDQHLPFADDGATRLAERCKSDSRLRRRLHSIVERGHLANVSIDDIRTHLQELELDEDDFIEDGKLVIDDLDPFQLMYVLNEDLFRGGLSEQEFIVDRKSPRE